MHVRTLAFGKRWATRESHVVSVDAMFGRVSILMHDRYGARVVDTAIHSASAILGVPSDSSDMGVVEAIGLLNDLAKV